MEESGASYPDDISEPPMPTEGDPDSLENEVDPDDSISARKLRTAVGNPRLPSFATLYDQVARWSSPLAYPSTSQHRVLSAVEVEAEQKWTQLQELIDPPSPYAITIKEYKALKKQWMKDIEKYILRTNIRPAVLPPPSLHPHSLQRPYHMAQQNICDPDENLLLCPSLPTALEHQINARREIVALVRSPQTGKVGIRVLLSPRLSKGIRIRNEINRHGLSNILSMRGFGLQGTGRSRLFACIRNWTRVQNYESTEDAKWLEMELRMFKHAARNVPVNLQSTAPIQR
ncbi:hypothetical protein IWQ60_002218 [Tieghemiomyces parasiticus]|uniref:Uncharacterized protein n=1 Tax=Tieghemiomyces parasiticus TaxID=78921 RepID=A0A9W8E1T7_9FUNG|nr:hypothetical protein IWQ60_002218 [Tieghemiomyces parasiticus]